MSEHKKGVDTSEYKKSKLAIVASIVLPIIVLLCDLLVNQSIATGTGAVIAGTISTALVAMGYQHTRGRVKASENMADALLKKSNPQ